MDQTELNCTKEIDGLRLDEQAKITSKMSLNENKDLENNCEIKIKEENIQNNEEDEDDDFGDFEEALPSLTDSFHEEKELDKVENCQKSNQLPTTSSTSTILLSPSTSLLTIADLLEQPQLIKNLKFFNREEDLNFDDLFEQMNNIEEINFY
ncbi:hypothetical protein Mgra_00005934 [Meloidogyne graminicola]|uniref:Uncharacterized protein n=1 Tax=Meloidogyne graminicola TaxID=189291 RepID=A0A8S9ZN14_9BILA|nr:hypothetical protein Mgra_00005934 [Meloidogyne graminicola]